MRTMRVLAVSDAVVEALYSSALRGLARGVEAVLSCGDLPSWYLEFIVSTLDVPLYYVMGNHGTEGGEHEIPEGCINLDGRVVNYKGWLIAGLEGSVRYNDRPRYQYTEIEMRAKVAALSRHLMTNKVKVGRYLDVLITHAPPLGIHDGKDAAHRGFKAYLWLMDHYHPAYLLHGHQHVYDTRTVRESVRGQTKIINVYGYKILELEADGHF